MKEFTTKELEVIIDSLSVISILKESEPVFNFNLKEVDTLKNKVYQLLIESRISDRKG